jgi:hypothetical protein
LGACEHLPFSKFSVTDIIDRNLFTAADATSSAAAPAYAASPFTPPNAVQPSVATSATGQPLKQNDLRRFFPLVEPFIAQKDELARVGTAPQSTSGGGAAASVSAALHRRNSKSGVGDYSACPEVAIPVLEAEAYFGGFWMHATSWLSRYTKVRARVCL